MAKLDSKKLFSGRFVFSCVTAFVFAYTANTRILDSDQVYGVIMLVVAFYFGKREEK